MRLQRLLLSAAIACGALAAASDSASAQQIPEQFHGLWQITQDGSAPSCSDMDADMRMTVMPDRVDFHEAGCDLLSIDAARDGERDIAMDFACRGEGEEWQDREVWTPGTDDGRQVLTIDRLGRDFPPLLYGRCDGAEAAASAADGTCYADGNSFLAITALDDTRAHIQVDSVQGGMHMCSMQGEAEAIDGGFRYIEQIDGVGECRLDILVAEDGGIGFRDEDSNCKRFYCGMRAALEHIEFAPGDEGPC